jgi:hypothetical protein
MLAVRSAGGGGCGGVAMWQMVCKRGAKLLIFYGANGVRFAKIR